MSMIIATREFRKSRIVQMRKTNDSGSTHHDHSSVGTDLRATMSEGSASGSCYVPAVMARRIRLFGTLVMGVGTLHA